MKYEEKTSIERGTPITRNDGLYAFTVVDDNYYIWSNDKSGIVLRAKGISAYSKGDYVVRLFSKEQIPDRILYDSDKSYDWILHDYFDKRANVKPQELFSEKRSFQGTAALYKEFFITGDIKNNFVKRPSYAYASLIFYNKGYLYWIYHSDPSESLDPRIEQKTRDKFQEFLDYFAIEFSREPIVNE